MPAPRVHAVRVPFYYSAPPPSADMGADGAMETPAAAPALITYALLEVISFGDRFFWMHVSESPASGQMPRLGSCSVSVGSTLCSTDHRPSISTTQLLEFEAARLQDVSAGANTTVQSVFAAGLSAKLAHGVTKQFHSPVTVYVNCSIEGDRCPSLLGTDGGSGFDVTYRFGELVYREAFAMVARLLKEGGKDVGVP
ncbi:hypothetical protein ABL78_5595 [Leptomonas seymouri]|uniref:Uncharacterized protein n=1 Tax=Leptomonas seymouri TaxID=5684 RepID=A0A0N1IJ46_LEPSE|nr:hypothetical protein ABL78_5595 [Leptomonas seymouri]|eukprot:KPI85340.1 hypothetical protein ABL78_5595 [Leptomonas seymouri]